MNVKIVILFVTTVLGLQCSNIGSGGDFAGGGVIGNPSGFTFGNTDTVKCKLVTVVQAPFSTGGSYMGQGTPIGSSSGKVKEQQHYSYSASPDFKRFRFVENGTTELSSWENDSVVLWTWNKAGICSVQVQIISDTTTWSDPLIVDIQE